MSRVQVWSDGVNLDGISRIGDLEWTTVHRRSDANSTGGGGLLTCSFRLYLPRGFTHPALRRGALVELKVGGYPIGSGVMEDPDRDEWTFTVDGLFRYAEWAVAATGTGAASTDLSVIIPAAIARGMLPGWRYSSLPTGEVSAASTTEFRGNYIADVIAEYCRRNNKRWYIDQWRYLKFYDAPTTPALALAPGTPAMAVAGDDYTTGLFGRYAPTTTTFAATTPQADAATATRWGGRESWEDIAEQGTLTLVSANALMASLFATRQARVAFTEGVEVSRSQISTLGGASPELWQVGTTPSMVRHHGWLDADGSRAYGKTVDWEVGSTVHRAGSPTVQIFPLDLAPRTDAQVTQAEWQRTRPGFQ